MKTLLGILFVSLGLSSLSCNRKTDLQNTTFASKVMMQNWEKIDLILDEKEHDFGTIDGTDKRNEFMKYSFEFTNHSVSPIIILKADVSCGCISTKIPDKPIVNGEKGVIEVAVDTKQVSGYFPKSVYVKSNAENDVVILHVKGSVKK